jgi:hypothetical protein
LDTVLLATKQSTAVTKYMYSLLLHIPRTVPAAAYSLQCPVWPLREIRRAGLFRAVGKTLCSVYSSVKGVVVEGRDSQQSGIGRNRQKEDAHKIGYGQKKTLVRRKRGIRKGSGVSGTP